MSKTRSTFARARAIALGVVDVFLFVWFIHHIAGSVQVDALVKGGAQIVSQLKGIVAVGAFSFIFSLVSFLVIKAIMGLRVSAEEEIEGLDIGEHGNEAYPDFTPAHK